MINLFTYSPMRQSGKKTACLRLNKFLGFLIIFSLFSYCVSAQNLSCEYKISGPGTGVSTDVGGTSVTLGDDQVSSALPIGFNFQFFGSSFTSFYISSNGFISFSGSVGFGCCSGGSLPDANFPFTIAGFWEDLNPVLGGTITYNLLGTAPNRRLTVSFDNIQHYPSGNPVTFQIKLYESTNVVDIQSTSCPSDGGIHTQGINQGSAANFVSGRSAANFSATNETVTFTPFDIIPPTFTNCANISANTSSVNCSANVSYALNATDNCSVARITTISGPASGASFAIGTTPVSVRARDDGASNTFSNGAGGTFTYNEGDSPQTISLKACESVYGTGNCVVGSCGSFTYYYRSGQFSCNCNKLPGQYEFVFANSGYTDVGQDYGGTNASVAGLTTPFARVKGNPGCSVTNTWFLADNNLGGNAVTCNFNVIVTDNQPPIITCPVNAVVACGGSIASGTLGTAVAFDNCSATVSFLDAGSANPPCGGTINRTWTATDPSTNSASCIQVITVNPAALPTMAAPANITVACGSIPSASTLNYSNGLSGGCLITGMSNVSTFTPAGTCGGTITETWTATDACSRGLAAVSRTITVSPAALPTMVAPANITIACGAALPLASTLNYSNGLGLGCLITGTSNVSTFTPVPGACGGTVTETWTATDACSRALIPVSRTITVSPAALPTMAAPANITIACGAVPAASTLTYSNGLSGGCLITGTSNGSTFTPAPGPCGGTITETWTATDACSRVLVAVSRMITVNPAALPTMAAPANITIACGALPSASTLNYTNGISGGACKLTGTSNVSTFTPAPGACGGTVTETWTATDACSRALTPVSRTITVSPAALPTMVAPADITVACGIVPSSGTLAYSNGLSGGCLLSGTSNGSTFSPAPSACGGTMTETWTATDACSRALVPVSRTITVSPAVLPTMVAPANITIACGAVPSSGTLTYNNGLSGGCLLSGISNGSTFSPAPGVCGGTITETWTATDACSRALVPVSRIITVSPASLPTMVAPANITVDCGAVPSSSTLNYSNGLSGGCLLSGISNGSTFTSLPLGCGSVTETWTAVDICGRPLANVSRVITVQDLIAPLTICPAPAVSTCVPIVSGIDAFYSDSCSTPSLAYVLGGVTSGSGSGQASGLTFNLGVTTVTYTATDACNNTSSCAFTVTVLPCGITLSGNVIWENNNNPVKDATVTLRTLPGLALVNSALTGSPGTYSLSAGSSGDYRIIPTKSLFLLNGVNAADATRIQQHISNSPPLTGPYKRIAADVNKSNSITTYDATLITQAVAGNPAALAVFNTSWRFVPAAYVFPNPNIPWGFPEKIDLTGVTSSQINQDFIGVKLGDVNGSGNPQLKPGSPVVWTVNNQVLKSGKTIKVTFDAHHFEDIAAFQFALGFDPTQLELVDIQSEGALDLTDDNFGAFNAKEGELRAVWSTDKGRNIADGTPVFTVTFKALQSGMQLSEVLNINTSNLEALAYNTALMSTAVQLVFGEAQASGTANPVAPELQVTLLQNTPNPFIEHTTIGFVLPQACDARLRILDINGRVITEVNKSYTAGYQQESFELTGITGVMCYELTTPFGTFTRKMTAVMR